MKTICVFALRLLIAGTGPLMVMDASASDRLSDLLPDVLATANRHLQTVGSGLVGGYEACPQDDRSEWGVEFVTGYDVKPAGDGAFAVLVDTAQCSGGNKHGQYFAMSGNGGTRLLLTDVIDDMRFIAENFYVGDGDITFQGHRWLENDPHCCPSQKGLLTYDLATGRASFQVNKD